LVVVINAQSPRALEQMGECPRVASRTKKSTVSLYCARSYDGIYAFLHTFFSLPIFFALNKPRKAGVIYRVLSHSILFALVCR
jgi:hypothetical protein